MLGELPEGSVIAATTIAGDFTLPTDAAAPVLLVAGGIGITPFASQLADAQATAGRDIVVLYSVPGPDEISDADVLERSGARVVLISSETIEDLPAGWSSVRGGRIDRKLLRATVPDLAERQVFVSGPPAMVAGVGAAARR